MLLLLLLLLLLMMCSMYHRYTMCIQGRVIYVFLYPGVVRRRTFQVLIVGVIVFLSGIGLVGLFADTSNRESGLNHPIGYSLLLHV